MANNSLSVSNLDYTGLREDLVSFMRNYPQFSDYDFEGSNLRTIIDLLAYNTYINSFYTNMAINEMFLDSAVLRDSVVSHSKNLNYMPRSARSAQAFIDITINPGDNPSYITIPAGQKFVGSNGNNVFTFVTTEDTIITPVSNTYVASNVALYEGVVLTEKFSVNTAIEEQRYVMSNPNIDTTSLKVYVTNDLGQSEEWTYYPNLFDVKTTTKAYFLQATGDNYEITFGNDITGVSPPNGATITATYRSCNKDKPNGIALFKATSSLGGYSLFTITPSSYANGTTIAASGGLAPETARSIRFNAPRAYQTLERAVTADDYRNILFAEFPEIRDVRVYGGDELDPPEYGKVYISVDLSNAVGLSELEKEKIQSFISTRAPISITPAVIEADYTMIGITSTVKYNLNKSNLAANDIRSEVLAAIQTYNTDNLGVFNTRFRYSQLLAAIDAADANIVDNETQTTLIKEFNPVLNENYTASLKYQNPIVASTIYSTAFTYNGLQCTLADDGAGRLFIVSTVDGVVTKLIRIGLINYNTGVINITNLNVSEYVGNYIALFVTPKNNDVTSRLNTIIEVDFENVTIQAKGIRL